MCYVTFRTKMTFLFQRLRFTPRGPVWLGETAVGFMNILTTLQVIIGDIMTVSRENSCLFTWNTSSCSSENHLVHHMYHMVSHPLPFSYLQKVKPRTELRRTTSDLGMFDTDLRQWVPGEGVWSQQNLRYGSSPSKRYQMQPSISWLSSRSKEECFLGLWVRGSTRKGWQRSIWRRRRRRRSRKGCSHWYFLWGWQWRDVLQDSWPWRGKA